jgi:hypothetical protein
MLYYRTHLKPMCNYISHIPQLGNNKGQLCQNFTVIHITNEQFCNSVPKERKLLKPASKVEAAIHSFSARRSNAKLSK